jgi:hypothetical protein
MPYFPFHYHQFRHLLSLSWLHPEWSGSASAFPVPYGEQLEPFMSIGFSNKIVA